jgi:hypothetical protein
VRRAAIDAGIRKRPQKDEFIKSVIAQAPKNNNFYRKEKACCNSVQKSKIRSLKAEITGSSPVFTTKPSSTYTHYPSVLSDKSGGQLSQTTIPHRVGYKQYIFTFLLLLVVVSTSFAAPDQQQLITLTEVGTDYLIYTQYDVTKTQRLDLSDLTLSQEIAGKNNLPQRLSGYWTTQPDFKFVLLSSGLAQLKNPETAPAQYLAAQEKAKQQGVGIWHRPPTPRPPQQSPTRTEVSPSPAPQLTPEAPSSINRFGKWVWGWISFLWTWIFSPIGLLGIMATALLTYGYKRFYIQRRLSLLIIGEPSTGKTALYLRLLNPSIDRQKILSLGPTQALQKITRRRYIQLGRFEIYPKLTDIPGGAPASVWDEFTGFKLVRNHALLLVLSSTMTNGREDAHAAKNQAYLDTQFGYLRAFVEGAMGARRTNKPKIIILFLNKFDLYSSQPPTDSTAQATKEQFKELFSKHIKSAAVAAEKAGIPFHVEVGSALENWNCETLVTLVGTTLYGH